MNAPALSLQVRQSDSGPSGDTRVGPRNAPRGFIVFAPVTKACRVCGVPITSTSANLKWCDKCRPAIEAEQNRRSSRRHYQKRKREGRS